METSLFHTAVRSRARGNYGTWAVRVPCRNRSQASEVYAAVEDRPLEERTLIEKARKGDLRAYKTLIESYEGLAFRTAYLIAGNAADAEEAVQEAFYRAYTALGRFRRDAPFRPWLLRIVANEAKDRRHASARRGLLALKIAEREPSLRSAGSPEGDVVAGEDRTSLLAALAGLSERDRTVVAYRYFLGLSEEEMATALGCPRGTIKSRLSRALDTLRRTMEATA